MSAKEAKKQAIRELIKHMNKKRFKDKELPKDELKKAMAPKETKKDEDDHDEDEAAETKKIERKEKKDSDFDKYRKEFMNGGSRESSKSSTLRVMQGERQAHKSKSPPVPRGFGSKKSG